LIILFRPFGFLALLPQTKVALAYARKTKGLKRIDKIG
jgi:hypothetical protein